MSKEQELPHIKEKKTVKNTKKNKTQMVVGHRYLYNPETGQEEKMTLIQKNINSDFGFHKVWLEDLLMVLNTIGDRKIKVLTYLLQIMDSKDNSMYFTQRIIAENTGVSLPTVNSTIKELKEANAIIQDKQLKQKWFFNPDLIMQGNSNKRKRMMIEYNLVDEINDDLKELHTNLKQNIEEILTEPKTILKN